MSNFDYASAFSRNLGLVSVDEQARLREVCVALPGLGGVGGAHLQTLARLGIQSFHLADPDTFEMGNLQRQVGATVHTLGRSKVEVMAETARAINPDAQVRTFPEGITPANIADFLHGVDIVVDGLEYFAMDARRLLYRECRKRGIPVVNAGPIGYGAAVLVFTPEGCSFDEFFGLEEGMTKAEQLLAMAIGLTAGLVRDVDPRYVDLERQRGPALATACLLCAAAAGTEVLKLVCGRGRLAAAPHGFYLDPYRGRTRSLRRKPSLTRSLTGRVWRWLAFRRFPAFRRMHEQELLARGQAVPDAPCATQPSS